MKICAVIAEYNPFHLGHLKQLQYIKNTLSAEKIIVLMSGNFTQRGEIAVMNKYKRARHAVLCGADLVIELPTVFATANAETFASGAIKLLSDLNISDCLCFGAESGTSGEFLSLANYLNDESKEFKKTLKEFLDDGVSFAKAKYLTVKKLGKDFDEKLISLPNNILGVEYTRAILKNNAQISIYPMLREAGHNNPVLKKGLTSASSIRTAIKAGQLKKIKKNIPPCVYGDITTYPYDFDKMLLSKVILTDAKELENISDCTEGLNNRIKALSKTNRTIDELVERVSTKRYTSARIRRILIANFFDITENLVKDCLKDRLYAKVLAVKSDSKDLLKEFSERSSVPVLVRKLDADTLKKQALECFNKDVLANDIYNLVTDEKENEYTTLFV